MMHHEFNLAFIRCSESSAVDSGDIYEIEAFMACIFTSANSSTGRTHLAKMDLLLQCSVFTWRCMRRLFVAIWSFTLGYVICKVFEESVAAQ